MSNRGRTPDSEEKSLWDRFVDGINPMHHKKNDDFNSVSSVPAKETVNTSFEKNEFYKPSAPPMAENLLDGKTLARLKKGKMPIEGKIDLHNKTQDQAYTALKSFVVAAFQSEKRCVLIVTGKGVNTRADDILTSKRDGIGVLKTRLPEWVAAPPLSDMVLRAQPAHRNHGGSGAFYLYLKKK